jgi:hypothetical protein
MAASFTSSPTCNVACWHIETFFDDRGKFGSPKPNIAWHPSLLVYEFATWPCRFTRRFELCNSSGR